MVSPPAIRIIPLLPGTGQETKVSTEAPFSVTSLDTDSIIRSVLAHSDQSDETEVGRIRTLLSANHKDLTDHIKADRNFNVLSIC